MSCLPFLDDGVRVQLPALGFPENGAKVHVGMGDGTC
jgi:hypothetical protein